VVEETVSFDILLRSAGSGGEPDISTIERFRASPADVARCRRWLEDHNVTVHVTEFGLSCAVTKDRFESLFEVALKPTDHRPGEPQFQMSSAPRSPREIEEFVDQITIMGEPEFF
jgi:hypothetical protein